MYQSHVALLSSLKPRINYAVSHVVLHEVHEVRLVLVEFLSSHVVDFLWLKYPLLEALWKGDLFIKVSWESIDAILDFKEV